MLLVPSQTRVERTDAGVDDLLRRLAALLPDTWIVAGEVAPKPVSDTCCRGYTRPFDAIIIGDRLIFVLDIWSRAGLIANRQKYAFFANIDDKAHLPAGFWPNFRREAEKLKTLLHDRFEVEPGRVVPDKIWSRGQLFDSTEARANADSADLRSFARAAIRQDKASSFRPLGRQAVDRISAFLTDVAKAAPEPTRSRPILLFADESPMPNMADRTAAASATPARIESSEDESQPASPALEAAPPVIVEAIEVASNSLTNPPDPVQAEVSPPPAAPAARPLMPAPIAPSEEEPELLLTEGDALAPRDMDEARPAASRPSDGNGAFDRELPVTRKSFGLSEEVSGPAPATLAVAVPVIADAAEARAAAHPTYVDGSLKQAAPPASVPAERRPTARRKWRTGLLLLMLVSQAGTIAWLALFERASPPVERAAPAPSPAPAVPAPAAPIATPFVVRALATTQPMLVGSEPVIVRAGPSPDFPSVGELGAGTEVVASASATGPGGSSWIEIRAANGAIGFVPDGMVEAGPVPALAIEQVVPPKQIPPPKIERAAAPKSKSARKIERATKPAKRALPEAVPTPPGVACILPGGEEIQASRSDCRAQSGIIYQ